MPTPTVDEMITYRGATLRLDTSGNAFPDAPDRGEFDVLFIQDEHGQYATVWLHRGSQFEEAPVNERIALANLLLGATGGLDQPAPISAELRHFFDVEERNREAMIREDGDAPVQTLGSAAFSLEQAPVVVIEEWFTPDGGDEPAAERIRDLIIEFATLLASHGPDRPLTDFTARED